MMPVGLQLGDFLQLRPAAQKSLCEWLEAPAATAAAPDLEAELSPDAEARRERT